MPLLRLLVRILWFVVVVVLIRFVLARLFRPALRKGGGPPGVITGRAHRDPKCGMYVAEELALRAVVGGREHFFCSPQCRDSYLPQ